MLAAIPAVYSVLDFINGNYVYASMMALVALGVKRYGSKKEKAMLKDIKTLYEVGILTGKVQAELERVSRKELKCTED